MASIKGPFYRALGIRLAEARRDAKVTQAALAQAVGLSRTSITNIEKGRQPLQIHVLARIAEVLHTNFSTLVPERSGIKEPTVDSKIGKLPEPAQAWVKRVIATYSEESIDDAEKLSSEEEGKRTISGGKGKSPARARGAVSIARRR